LCVRISFNTPGILFRLQLHGILSIEVILKIINSKNAECYFDKSWCYEKYPLIFLAIEEIRKVAKRDPSLLTWLQEFSTQVSVSVYYELLIVIAEDSCLSSGTIESYRILGKLYDTVHDFYRAAASPFEEDKEAFPGMDFNSIVSQFNTLSNKQKKAFQEFVATGYRKAVSDTTLSSAADILGALLGRITGDA
jgi:hypothetical protein